MNRAWPMSVSVEQVALVIQQMDVEERRRLIALVPDLRNALIGCDCCFLGSCGNVATDTIFQTLGAALKSV